MSSVAFCTTHKKMNTRKCDTEGVVPIASLNGVIGSPSFLLGLLLVVLEKYNLWYTLM